MPDQDPRWRAAMHASIVIGILALVFAVIAIAYQGNLNRDLNEQQNEISQRLIDCTEPGGNCYEKGQDATAAAVVGINEGTLRVITAALSCQEDGIVDQTALSRCTVKRAKQAASQ